jgi:isoleucyl-tRNA synthetase
MEDILFKPVDSQVKFPKMEEGILQFWKDNSIFKKSIDQRQGSEEYIFYDGPPFATGLPHFGHFVPGTIKDIIPRYKTMKGKLVHRRFGWDCHGLPVEYEMEKELGISGRKSIEDFGVAKFNESCRSIVLRYTEEWEQVMTRSGRWVDFQNDYKTMNPDYMESIWWVFKELWEKNLIYEGYYILPYSPKLATPLSNFEVNQGGYKLVDDPAITVRFKLENEKNTYILAWTTTPWTLPSNLGLALGPDIDYVKVQDGEDYYILAESRLEAYYKHEEDYEVVARYKGSDLYELDYEPLFPYFAELKQEGAFKTLNAEFVTTEDGTGIVHIAPGFGEDDYNTMKERGVSVVVPLDADCNFTSEVSDFEGLFVKDADKPIIQMLKEQGKLVKKEIYRHNYPHCYRTKAPLIYRAISSWFVKIDPIKEKMLNANDKIQWIPNHLQKGRFGKWLEGARDWAISRNRFWGNPLPVWKCEECGKTECIGSREELKERTGTFPDDLHKHFVDELSWDCDCGGTFKRIPEVLDCWFESGAMPYAQNHYPFENKKHFESNFPADFISEGLDQTRGWFYTLTILAAALFDKPAFENVIVNGLVLAEDGKKMSKSERNYTDPSLVMNEYGADALRLFLMNSAVVRAEDLKYSDEGVKEVVRGIILPLWNSYSFFVGYANIDNIEIGEAPENPVNPLDRWILSEAETLIAQVTEMLDSYELQRAIAPIVAFIDSLNNWYIRRSKRRFWKSENDSDKQEAYNTLYAVLLKLIHVAAPIIPFVTEEIYQNLRKDDMPLSVHLADYPQANNAIRDEELELKMKLTRQTVSMGRALRMMHNLRIRLPLKALHLVTRDSRERTILREMSDIIMEELNVKDVIFRENEDELVEYSAKANFKLLGKQLGKDMKAAASKIQELHSDEIQSLLEGATLEIDLGDKTVELTNESIMVQRTEKEGLNVLNEGSLTVAIDPHVTDELYIEGLSRDIIREIQKLRKDRDLEITDRIKVYIMGEDKIQKAVQEFKDKMMDETLADSIDLDVDRGDTVICADISFKLDLEKI